MFLKFILTKVQRSHTTLPHTAETHRLWVDRNRTLFLLSLLKKETKEERVTLSPHVAGSSCPGMWTGIGVSISGSDADGQDALSSAPA